MSTDTAPPRRRRFLRRPRLADALIVAFVTLLALAVVVNGVTDVHDVRRARLDKKLAASWFRSHPELGRFGPPVIKVHQRRDFACAARRPPAGVKNPVDGLCISIEDTSASSKRVLNMFRCIYLRPGVSRKGKTVCPPRHGDATGT